MQCRMCGFEFDPMKGGSWDNAKVAIRQFVQDADMEIHSLMKRNLITFQNFKIN